jgi:hypothetical protein
VIAGTLREISHVTGLAISSHKCEFIVRETVIYDGRPGRSSADDTSNNGVNRHSTVDLASRESTMHRLTYSEPI